MFLARTDSDLLAVDTAANIAGNLSNLCLVSRVSLFSMNGSGAVLAWQAMALAAVGSQFSMAGHKPEAVFKTVARPHRRCNTHR